MTSAPLSFDRILIAPAQAGETAKLAQLWHEGWHDAHAELLPLELKQVRTLQTFLERISQALHQVRVARFEGEPIGFYLLDADELNQFYVARSWRGHAVAKALLADAEAMLVQSGRERGWLACAIGNHIAARFYEKFGWCRTGVVAYKLEMPALPLHLDVWRYEKRLELPAT